MKITKNGNRYSITDGACEVAEIQSLGFGHHDVRVHDVYFTTDGEPNRVGGTSSKSFSQITEAFLYAGYLIGKYSS